MSGESQPLTPVSSPPIKGLLDLTPEVPPVRTGIYFLCHDDSLLYVGQTKKGGIRPAEHRSVIDFNVVYLLPCDRTDLDDFEGALIRHLRPPRNGRHPKTGTIIAPRGSRPDEVNLAMIGIECPKPPEIQCPSQPEEPRQLEDETVKVLKQFDTLADDAVIPTAVTVLLFGGILSEKAIHDHPKLQRIEISTDRYGQRVGDIRAITNSAGKIGKPMPKAAA